MNQPPGGDPPEEDGDDATAERRDMTRLVRWVGVFAAWPSLTSALAFLVLDGDSSGFYVAGLLVLGVAAVLLVALAPRLAAKFVP